KFGAEKLLNKAQAYYDNKNFESSKEQLEILLQKYPASSETDKGRHLLVKVENELKRIKLEENLRKKREQEEKLRRLNQATKNMRKRHDEFKKVTWFRDFSSPTYTNTNGIFLYFGKDDDRDNADNLRFIIQYYAEDWLFIQNYQFNIDDKTFSYYPSDIETDSGYGGKIWEWSDEPINRNTYEIVKAIIDSRVAKIRFNGRQYYKTKTISYAEKQSMKNVLNAYEALGGSLNFY
ncbi:hypothetical protein JXO59_05535, partial [candidate division KSB1 bacterium]|nr:hypothetical protein [candidate division KSB1 bacterium]